MNNEIRKIKKEMESLESKIHRKENTEARKKYNRLGVELHKKILRAKFMNKNIK